MKQTTAQVSTFTPEGCAKWLNQLSEIKAQIMDSYEASNIKECIKDQISEIDDQLDIVAIDVSEILKQQHLNDNYFYLESNNR